MFGISLEFLRLLYRHSQHNDLTAGGSGSAYGEHGTMQPYNHAEREAPSAIYLGIVAFEFLLDSPNLEYSMYSAIWLHS